jgi:hypothetical protein
VLFRESAAGYKAAPGNPDPDPDLDAMKKKGLEASELIFYRTFGISFLYGGPIARISHEREGVFMDSGRPGI